MWWGRLRRAFSDISKHVRCESLNLHSRNPHLCACRSVLCCFSCLRLDPRSNYGNGQFTQGHVAMRRSRKVRVAMRAKKWCMHLDDKKARGVAVNPWALIAKNTGGYTIAHVFNSVRMHFAKTALEARPSFRRHEGADTRTRTVRSKDTSHCFKRNRTL